MTRDSYNTVTKFVLLIPALEAYAQGQATFLAEYLIDWQHVRAVTIKELKQTAQKLRGAEAAGFDALLALKGALESGDKLAEGKAMERMERTYRLRIAEMPEGEIPGGGFGAFLSPVLKLPPGETAQYVDGLRAGPRATVDPARLLSFEVSRAVGSVPEFYSNVRRKPSYERPQIVLWWHDGEFRPAIYCPDVRSALYIHTFFLAPTGALGFRICPYDGEQFFQERPNQEYCCPAHREAHRVARFRDKKKRELTKTEGSRRKHGTQKAR